MKLSHIDHLVLTVNDIETSCRFYNEILGMEVLTFGNNRKALRFGQQKINLHPADQPFAPHARHPTAGSADLCLISETPLGEVLDHFKTKDITPVEEYVERTGAVGTILSIYLNDPDGNLIEISEYV
ncbi:MAG: VOC family protein [Pseudomonadota bacterium]|nr:VOC family protein [Pseudomonadota bacterium]